MDDDTKVALSLGAISIAFTWLYGTILFYPIANFADYLVASDSNYAIISIVLLNLPSILLIESGSVVVWLLIEGGLHYTTSIASGIGYWCGYMFLDYWEPPASVLANGTIVKDTLGWSGTSDVVVAYFFQNVLHITQDQLYTWTYAVGPLIFLAMAFVLGGTPVLVKLFAGEEAAEELEED